MIIFFVELVYYGSRLYTTSLAWVNDFSGAWDVPDEKFKFAVDVTLLITPFICSVMSFISFIMKSRVMKYFLLITDLLFLAGCIYAFVMLPADRILYGASGFYAFAVAVACISCIIADYDDMLLSQIEGYPDFNPLFIHEDVPITSGVRFADKKSNERLYDERVDEFIKENPDSVMASIFIKEKKEKEEAAIDDWLDGMMGKNRN